MERTVQRKRRQLDELQDIERLQSNIFPQAHRGKRRSPVPTERALLLQQQQLYLSRYVLPKEAGLKGKRSTVVSHLKALSHYHVLHNL